MGHHQDPNYADKKKAVIKQKNYLGLGQAAFHSRVWANSNTLVSVAMVVVVMVSVAMVSVAMVSVAMVSVAMVSVAMATVAMVSGAILAHIQYADS